MEMEKGQVTNDAAETLRRRTYTAPRLTAAPLSPGSPLLYCSFEGGEIYDELLDDGSSTLEGGDIAGELLDDNSSTLESGSVGGELNFN